MNIIKQAEVMRRFRRDYQFVYEHITHCTSPSRNSQQQQQMQGAGGVLDAAGMKFGCHF